MIVTTPSRKTQPLFHQLLHMLTVNQILLAKKLTESFTECFGEDTCINPGKFFKVSSIERL